MWPFTKKDARSGGEARAAQVSDAAAMRVLFAEWGGTSSSGVVVNPDVAMSIPAVWCAVGFLSDTIAALSLDLYKQEGKKGDTLATRDPLYSILHDVVNDDLLTAFQWRALSMHNTLIHGRSFTFIERNLAGRVMNLWPLEPGGVTVQRVGGRRQYKYVESGTTVVYKASEIIDIPWKLKSDGLSHYDPVLQFRDAVGLAKAIENFGAKFFENGGVPPLVLQGPIAGAAGAKRAADDIQAAVRNANSERRNVLVMPTGHELKDIGFDPSKGQMTEARRFQIEEFARWFNLPPVFLQDLTRGTFSNTEQQDIHLVKHTMRHWLRRWEDELNAKLFPATNRKNFVMFDDDELLRGDLKSRMDAYSVAIQNGIYTPNEVRETEKYPNSPAPDADKLHIQGATVPLGEQVKPAQAATASTGNETDDEAA